ncbi:MAG: TIGR03619 family F420-dependent LLM class oxidoreductase [Solirubrobacterales bacterium]|nr:TIGR03619 family F420-dependent LLM class oxidoreductase [Solirubrobacterales bacterium]
MSEAPRLVLVLTENWTLVDPADPMALVDLARQAEEAGIDAVMLSEHIVLGPSADENGLMDNPREYALPGNQDPAMPWPNSIVLMSAIAAATQRLRLVGGAIITPLRHPLLLARELGTLDLLSRGRLVVLPTVSWHRDEYEALGVDFGRRGKVLDEQLAVWEKIWRESPVSHQGDNYRFEDVWLEPKAFRGSGPVMWFGGSSIHPALMRRLVRYGSGFNPLGRMSDEELQGLAVALREAGRDPAEMEMVGGLRGTFPDDESTADLAQAVEDSVPDQLERGFTSYCFKPNQFTDDVGDWSEVCKEAVARVGETVKRGGGVEAARSAWATAGSRGG